MSIKVFSEYSDSSEDMMSGLGADEMGDVGTRIASHGVECVFGCQTCGWQSKMILEWPEILAVVYGQKVHGIAPIQQGVSVLSPCRRCAAQQPMFLSWDEIRHICADGVKRNILGRHQVPQQILFGTGV
jgi:hypothetical protein